MVQNRHLTTFFGPSSGTVPSNVPATDAEWERLLGEAYRECVLPMLASQARERHLTPAIPTDIIEVLNATEILNNDRNQLMLKEAVHIARLLNQINIRPVALKGVAYLLTGVCSSESGSRYLHDLDLLVPKSQAAAAFDHLLAGGYGENHADYFASIRHHYPGISRPGMPVLELHTQVGLGVCDRILPVSALTANAQSIRVDGAEFLIPSPTHLVAHLILHSQLAHPYKERLFPPLRALDDLVQLQRHFGPNIDWGCLADMFGKAGHFNTLALHLKTAYEVIGFRSSSGEVSNADAQLKVLFPAEELDLWLTLGWYRRLVLSRWPTLRFIDPGYIVMSLFSRRLRLLPGIIENPRFSVEVLRSFVRRDFYRKLFSV